MICTEEEARKKWCPMVVLAPLSRVEPYTIDVRRESSNPIIRNCIASDCMMWRGTWKDRSGETIYAGYCGLGGKP